MLILCWQYVRAFLLIYLCLYIGNLISSVLSVAIPGSIIGMLLLFALLAFHIIPDVWVKPGCQLMIRYMTLLFVPIGVGIMKYYDLIVSQFGAVVVSCLASTFIVLLVVGYSAHWTYREKPDGK